MKSILTITLFALIESCTNLNKNATTPYQQYRYFSALIKTKDYDQALLMFSPYNQKLFQNRDPSENFETFFPFISSIDGVIDKEINHYQKYLDDKSCLTVTGFNTTGEPTSLSFEFINNKGSWKFQHLHMAYYELESYFPNEAYCPVIP